MAWMGLEPLPERSSEDGAAHRDLQALARRAAAASRMSSGCPNEMRDVVEVDLVDAGRAARAAPIRRGPGRRRRGRRRSPTGSWHHSDRPPAGSVNRHSGSSSRIRAGEEGGPTGQRRPQARIGRCRRTAGPPAGPRPSRPGRGRPAAGRCGRWSTPTPGSTRPAGRPHTTLANDPTTTYRSAAAARRDRRRPCRRRRRTVSDASVSSSSSHRSGWASTIAATSRRRDSGSTGAGRVVAGRHQVGETQAPARWRCGPAGRLGRRRRRVATVAKRAPSRASTSMAPG